MNRIMMDHLSRGGSRRRPGDAGFTLIELIVVVIIIGILAAIAIPVFLGQQEQARNAATKSALTNAKTLIVAEIVETGAWPANAQTIATSVDPKVTVTVKSGSLAGFCLVGVNKQTPATTYYVTQATGVTETAC